MTCLLFTWIELVLSTLLAPNPGLNLRLQLYRETQKLIWQIVKGERKRCESNVKIHLIYYQFNHVAPGSPPHSARFNEINLISQTVLCCNGLGNMRKRNLKDKKMKDPYTGIGLSEVFVAAWQTFLIFKGL